jgi:glycine/D-amino acid oxidase-like deaminating enzyme
MDSAIVVGAGSFGASIAWTLARRGISTTLIDQYEPGDPRASSGGETRLYRCCHGPDVEYAAMARRSRELWKELEAETGEELLVERGVAWFAHRDDGWEAHSEKVLTDLGIPNERVDASELYPSFRGDDVVFTLLEPEAGAIRAARAVRALVTDGRASGLTVVRGRARPAAGGVEIDGVRRLTAGMVVWACGAWLPLVFPGLVDLRVTRQDLFFLDGGPEWANAPCFVDYDAAMYGTPDIDGLGVKLAPDVEGPSVSADDPLGDPDPDNDAVARAYAEKRFPGLGAAALTGWKTCRYELSPDSHFIAAPHPFEDDWWIVGGGSGHGFKHGPALAEKVVGAMLGEGPPLDSRFALGQREPGRSFRTSGSGG